MARRPLEHPRNWAFLAAGEFLAGLTGYTSGIAELDNALDAEAAPINAKTGTLVSYEHLGGGLDGPRTLGVITLRAGNAEEVAKAQIKDVEAAGFSANHLFLPCGGQTGACSFLGQSTVTDVMIETVAANTTTRSGLEIPPGMTGVIISLSAQPGRAVPTSGAAEAPPSRLIPGCRSGGTQARPVMPPVARLGTCVTTSRLFVPLLSVPPSDDGKRRSGVRPPRW